MTSTTSSAASSSSTDEVSLISDTNSKKKRAFAKWYGRGGGGGDEQRRQCGANIEASREEGAATTPTTSLGSLGLSLDDDDDDDDEEVDSLLSGSLWSRILDTPSPTVSQLPSSRGGGAVDERQNDKTLLDYMYTNVDCCIDFISCSSATATATTTTTTTNHVNELPILGLPIVDYFEYDNYIISTRREINNIAPRSRRREGDDSFDTNDDEQQQQQHYYIAQVLSSTRSDEISSDKQSYESGLSTWGSLLDLDTPLATADIEEEVEEVDVLRQQRRQEEEEHNNNSGSSNRSYNSTNNVESFTTKHVNVASTEQQQQCQSVDKNELSSSLSTSLRLLPMEELVSTDTIAVERTSEGRSNDNDSISINSSLKDNIGILGIAPMSCLHNNNLDNTDVGFMIYNNNNLDQESNTRTILSRMLFESFIIPSNNIIGIKEMTKPLTTTTTTTTPIHTQLRQMVHARMKTKKNHHTTKQSSATASIIHQSTIVRRNKKSTHHGSCLLPLHNNTTTTTATMTTTTPTVSNNTNNISPLTMAKSNKGDLQRAIRRHERRNCRRQQQQQQQ